MKVIRWQSTLTLALCAAAAASVSGATSRLYEYPPVKDPIILHAIVENQEPIQFINQAGLSSCWTKVHLRVVHALRGAVSDSVVALSRNCVTQKDGKTYVSQIVGQPWLCKGDEVVVITVRPSDIEVAATDPRRGCMVIEDVAFVMNDPVRTGRTVQFQESGMVVKEGSAGADVMPGYGVARQWQNENMSLARYLGRMKEFYEETMRIECEFPDSLVEGM